MDGRDTKKPRKTDGPRKDTYFKLPMGAAPRRESGSTTTPYERHKALVKDYMTYYNPSPVSASSRQVTSELSILKEHHTFLREEDAAEKDEDMPWEARVALKYYNALFKEYALGKFGSKGRLALRWRSKAEVVSGKGQFICGSLDCTETGGLASYEVLFVYMESAPGSSIKEKKSALVKLRVCPSCAETLKAGRRSDKNKSAPASSSSSVAQEAGAEMDESLKRKRSEEGTLEKAPHKSLDPSAIWSKPIATNDSGAGEEEEQDEELSRDRDFDSYFADLLK
jgi:protein FRA10AC1